MASWREILRFLRVSLCATGLLMTAVMGSTRLASAQAEISIDTTRAGIQVSPRLYGIFYEEISRAGDGGLYAEMLENRSFEDFNQPVGWQLLTGKNSTASMTLDRSVPLNDTNPTSLRLEIHSVGQNGSVGVSNQGFKGALVPDAHDPIFSLANAAQDKELPVYKKWLTQQDAAQKRPVNGISLVQGKTYDFSIYLRADPNFSGPVFISLESPDGKSLANQKIGDLKSGWEQRSVHLVPSKSEPDARLVVSTRSVGTLWMDMVSLFPADTFGHRPNGLRADLMQMLEALHPAFVRFPGGSYAEGYTLRGAYRWKETIGDTARRPGHWNIWGYRSSDGLGFQELLQMAEDLHAEPLYVPNCGIAEKEMVPVSGEDPWIQDALDAIAYANAPADTPWGTKRANAGHAAPFSMKLMEIGNENGMSYSWGGGNAKQYAERYMPFYDKVKKEYPDILTIATAPIHKSPYHAPVEVLDEHYYPTAEWFERHADQYDTYDRNGPKIYVGEYATKPGAGHGNLRGALGEAAFMTGMERNSDVVVMSSYAPLLVNPNWDSWEPDAIVFDSSRVYGTPSYYNQMLFANNRPDVVLPLSLETPEIAQQGSSPLKALYAVAGKQDASGDFILKVVNIDSSADRTTIRMNGLGDDRLLVHGTVLTSKSPNDENSFTLPKKVSPAAFDLKTVPATFEYTFAPYSITILRMHVAR